MQKITPFLWFDNQAEAGADFYVSVFNNAKIGEAIRYGEAEVEVLGDRRTRSWPLPLSSKGKPLSA